MPGKPLILVVDDEADVRELVSLNLRRSGFAVEEAADGLEAVRIARRIKPQVIVLDVMMPGRDGLQVCEELRHDEAMRRVPILMLTARGMVEHRIAGLEVGADDYLPKPFSPKELVLRLRALLRRSEEAASGGKDLDAGPFHFDMATVRVTAGGEPLDLTLLEFKLLHLLASQQGRVLERDVILREVWGYADSARTRTLDTHIKRLREKVGAHADWIQTARGVGYLFKKPAGDASTGN